MEVGLAAYVDHWRSFVPNSAPFRHPKDKDLEFNGPGDGRDIYRDYLESSRFRAKKETDVEASLYPSPHAGDLQRAKVYFLLLNPGLSLGDFYVEQHDRDFRPRLLRTIRQEDLAREEFPFLWLDPKLCTAPGFVWWEKKLQPLLKAVVQANNARLRYVDAMRFLSKHIAAVELFPYHSKAFKGNNKVLNLPSVLTAKPFAKELAARARRGEIAVLVMRGSRHWDIGEPGGDLLVYDPAHSRGAHIDKGRVETIMQHLGPML